MKRGLLSPYRVKDVDVGIPEICITHINAVKSKKKHTLFDLSSHARAKEAIAFGLKLRHNGFHVCVVGEDRSGRMTATLRYLSDYVKNLPPPMDWVYLNNFEKPHKPLPFQLPNGLGRKLKKHMQEHVKNLETLLRKTFTSPSYLKQLDKMSVQFEQQSQDELQRIQNFALNYGLEILQTPEGFHIQERDNTEGSKDNGITKSTSKKRKDANIAHVKDQLNRLSLSMNLAGRHITKHIKILQETLAKNATKSLWQKISQDYEPFLGKWLEKFETDVLDNLDLFLADEEEKSKYHFERYAVNLFVDQQEHKHPRVFLESMPTYENLFGAIKHRVSAQGSYETHFTMIRPGALHRANGGILVLRAEALAKDPDVWEHLKASLRDKCVRIEDHQREHLTSPLIDAPAPKAIPLDIQVFIVGQPFTYYSFFFSDPEFRSYFKIKADIDPDLEINDHNIAIYCDLIREATEDNHGCTITSEAMQYLIQCSARWAGNREKLSGRFEIVHDVISESVAFANLDKTTIVDKAHIRKTLLARRARNARMEDYAFDQILKGDILIDTDDVAVGQINALTVLSSGDHDFGLPARISARTYAGNHGVINIERLTDMAGPIQQKGAFILDGFLNGMFSQQSPISFSCSLTFEQSYNDVEGDSASLAELCAILSSLSDIPLRQDLAVTGSINQFGITQAVGGIHHKIEGFFEICQRRGLSGTQGVIIPISNKRHLTVKDEIVDAIREGLFHIYAVQDVFEALELLTGIPSRFRRGLFGIKRTGVMDKAYLKLQHFHKVLQG